MNTIQNTLQTRLDNIQQQREKPVKLYSEVQVEAFDLIEKLSIKEKQKIGILLRLAKINLPLFQIAKRELHARDKDGLVTTNKFAMFLWLYKHNNPKNK